MLACILFTLLLTAAAQQIQISPGFSVTQKQLDDWTRSLPKTDKELWFFHWGPVAQSMRYVDAGTISQDELNWFIRNPSGQLSAGGFYMSQDRYDSSSYGPYCVVAIVDAGTPIYRQDNVSILGVNYLSDIQKSLLGAHVPFIHQFDDYFKTWFVTHSSQVLKKLVSGASLSPPVMPRIARNEQEMWSWMKDLREAANNNGYSKGVSDSINWLDSFYNLFYYMDAVALSRAIRVNPNDPWHEFEPEHFENFRNTRRYLLDVLDGKQHPGVSRGGVLGAGMSKNDWVRNQTDVVIPMLWSSIAGTVTKNVTIRGEEVRAGGADQPRNTFLANAPEMKALQDNLYLTVESTPNGADFDIAYYYPDVFHFQGVAKNGYISASLAAELQREQSNMKNDVIKRERNNRRLLQELLQNLFSRWYGKKIDTLLEATKFMVEFVSIHPYEDYNGRTTRMYAHLACYESAVGNVDYRLPHEYMSDFDTLFPPKKYGQFTEDSSKFILNLMLNLQFELMSATGRNAMPNYYGLIQWKDLQRSLGMLGLKAPVDFDATDNMLIEHRQFTQLLNKIIGPKWGDNLN